MTDKLVPFFNPADVLSLGGTWIQQENNISDSVSRAQGLGATGDEAAFQTHDGKSAGTVVYEDHSGTGSLPALTLPKAGEVKGGYHIDNLSLVYNPVGWPKLTCTVHQHDTNAHAAAGLNTFTATPIFPSQFGIPRVLETTIFSITDEEAGVKGMTYTLACTHQDEPNEVGNHLAGENRDGIETLAVEFTKYPAIVTCAWTEMTDGSPKSNTAAETGSFSYENHIARDV